MVTFEFPAIFTEKQKTQKVREIQFAYIFVL